MNLSEFKAWFEGFTESLTTTPNAAQWKRIQEKIGKIEDAPPTTRAVFVDHWYPPWRRWYGEPVWLGSSSGIGIGHSTLQQGQNTSGALYSSTTGRHDAQTMQTMAPLADGADAFDSAAAFRTLGRAEMKSMRG